MFHVYSFGTGGDGRAHRWARKMVRKIQFSIRSIFLATTVTAVSLTVSELFELSIVQGIGAVASSRAFILGPYLLIWGALDWRPVLEHKRSWTSSVISFAMLLVNPWIIPVLLTWWLVNIPGYLIFWIIIWADASGRPPNNARAAEFGIHADSP